MIIKFIYMMNKVKASRMKFGYLGLILAAMLHGGCSDNTFSAAEEDTPMRFRCDSVETRAAGYAQSGDNAITSMGIYASHTSNNWTPSAPINFMTNQEVTRQDASSPWTYTPEVLWPGSGYTTFFAYAPYGAKH